MPATRLAIATACFAAGALALGFNGIASCDDGGHSSGGVNPAGSDGSSEDATAKSDASGAGDSMTGGDGTEQAADDGAADSVTAEPDAGLANAPPATVASIRFANWAPDSPAIDFCVAPHGTGMFVGPVAQRLEAAADGGSTPTIDGSVSGSFPFMSAYMTFVPGRYDVRLVVAGAGSCVAAIRSDATSLPAFGGNTFATVALLGEVQPAGGDPGLSLAVFSDDLVAITTGVSVRFINASPSLSRADFGTGLPPGFAPLFLGVGFGQHGNASEAQIPDAAAPLIDGNGYLAISAPSTSGSTLTVFPSSVGALYQDAGITAMASSRGWAPAAGAVVTIAIVGGTSSGIPASLVQCVDSAGVVGPLSDCAVLAP
jgi:hypothetical protein